MKKNSHKETDEEPIPLKYQLNIGIKDPKQVNNNKSNNTGDDRMGQIQANQQNNFQKGKEIVNESKSSNNKKNLSELIQNKQYEQGIYDEPEEKIMNIGNTYGKYKASPIIYSGKKNDGLSSNYFEINTREEANVVEEDIEHIQKSPNPTISISSKSNYNIYSPKHGNNLNSSIQNNSHRNNYFQDYLNKDYKKLKSEKSVGVLSDTSIKPRKGDRTPKSNNSLGNNTNSNENESNRLEEKKIKSIETKIEDEVAMNDFNQELKKEDFNKELKKEDFNNRSQNIKPGNEVSSISPNNFKNNISYSINNKHKSSANDKHKTQTSQISSNDKNYLQYDVQQLSYDLIKEYSHLRIDKEENFMRRMLFDVFKRQSKEERMEKLLERNKVKIDENDRIKAFNRLIEDANRRLEAQEQMESMKIKLEENELPPSINKKYKFEEWEEIYEERFAKFKNDKEKWIEERAREKIMKEKEKEDEILENTKTRKVPGHVVDQIVKRMYEEAERRKLKMEEYRKKNSEEDDNQYDENDENYRNREREMTPSKFKKFKNIQKYNFQSDMSGNEHSEEERDIPYSLINKSKAKVNSMKTDQKKSKTNTKNSNRIEVGDRLHQKLKKPTKEESQNKKKSSHLSNTEFNNKRFERADKVQYNIANDIIGEENLIDNKNRKPNNKIIHKNQTNIPDSNKIEKNIKKFGNEYFNYDVEDEEQIRNIPKPIEASRINNQTKEVKLSDLKKLKTNQILGNNQLLGSYMPDYLASKLVENILQGKINN